MRSMRYVIAAPVPESSVAIVCARSAPVDAAESFAGELRGKVAGGIHIDRLLAAAHMDQIRPAVAVGDDGQSGLRRCERFEHAGLLDIAPVGTCQPAIQPVPLPADGGAV